MVEYNTLVIDFRQKTNKLEPLVECNRVHKDSMLVSFNKAKHKLKVEEVTRL